jgi:peroxiredoxin
MRIPWIAPLLLVAALVASLDGCKQPSGPPEAAGTTGVAPTVTLPPVAPQKAPSFSVVDIDGTPHSLADYKGHIVVVDFWATYCKPCVKKLREYESLYQANRGRGVDFIALSMDETDAVVKGWREENDVTFPLARVDEKTRTAFLGASPLVAIPQVRIIDRRGMIRYALGPEGTAEQLEAGLKALLAERR